MLSRAKMSRSVKQNRIIFPRSGDLVQLISTAMRSWENENFKGKLGPWLRFGELGLIVSVRVITDQFRVQLLTKNGVQIFSCKLYDVYHNWRILAHRNWA